MAMRLVFFPSSFSVYSKSETEKKIIIQNGQCKKKRKNLFIVSLQSSATKFFIFVLFHVMSMWIYIEDEKKNLEQQNKITKSSLYRQVIWIIIYRIRMNWRWWWWLFDDTKWCRVCVCVTFLMNHKQMTFFYMNKNVLI